MAWSVKGRPKALNYGTVPHHLMHALPKFNPPHSKMDCIAHNDRIELAIADLESQVCLNYADAAKKWNIDRSMLSRRHRGVTGLKQDQYSYTAKALTDVQENVLIRYINDLSARGLLLIS
jgi:S-adenosylmethionine synthetase